MSTPQRVAEAARAVPGVVDLHGGMFGEVATYLPGEKVTGVRLTQTSGEVHIVVDTQRPAHQVGAQVREAAEQLAGVPITVVVADLVVEQES